MRGIEALNGIVWGPVGLGLLFGTGLLLTVRTGGFQLRRWGYWMRHTLGAILTDRSVTAHTAREEQAISQFQSLCTALASTIGTGNLVGVATAILSGGAGAVFWMWVMALLGMMTSYAENVLGIYYRRKDPAGGWRGGPMYYLRDGLGGKPGRVLAVLFAAFCALASFGIGNLSQLNSIAGNLQAAFGVPESVTGAVLAAVSAVILLGGLKRVAAVAERLVPRHGAAVHRGCAHRGGGAYHSCPGGACRHRKGRVRAARRRWGHRRLWAVPGGHLGASSGVLFPTKRGLAPR